MYKKMNEATYYQKNRYVLVSTAKDYYKNDKERLGDNARDKFKNLSQKEKTTKRNMEEIDIIICMK